MILHEHYVKGVSSKSVIHRNSVMSLSSKRIILTQQCLKIMLNCNTHIGWKKISEHLSFYMARMQASGYDHSLRLEIVRSAIGAYDKMIEADEKQERPLYRKREWRRKERRKEKDAKRNKWHKKGGYSSVLFVAATPQSELRNKMQEVDKTKFKIKVIEKSGKKLIRHLQRNDPFKKNAETMTNVYVQDQTQVHAGILGYHIRLVVHRD